VWLVEIAAHRAAQYWEPMRSLNVVARQALSRHDSPFGAVGLMHEGADLKAWWIWKDREEIEPTLAVMDRDDLIFIVQGSLRLELEGRDPIDLRAGDLFVIPAGTPFRGYRWPRESEPCQFVAVAPVDASFNRVEGHATEDVRR
jgi:mannose-6-phosphate isomerase-like protein (cupin superfamily)